MAKPPHHTQVKEAELRTRIRDWLVRHPGARPIEVARYLGLHQMTAGKHINAIRREWQQRERLAASEEGRRP